MFTNSLTLRCIGRVLTLQIGSDMPDVKLFGKWSLTDVQVTDMSLQVRSTAHLNLPNRSLLFLTAQNWRSKVIVRSVGGID